MQLTQTLHLHGVRALLMALVVFAFFIVHLDSPLVVPTAQASVKSYATSVSRHSLLNATNQARLAAGKLHLTENERLNQAAQAKAEDMAAKNYWAHVAPDGSQPWVFFEDAGYIYRTAGENLAYGFADSEATVAAWMKSPTHRENILGDYQEVGFGIAHSPNYQGGNYTIIVAHYGAPAETIAATTTSQPPVSFTAPTSPTIGQQLVSGNAPLLALIGLSVCAGAALMFGLTHRRLLAHAAVNGERFALRHPMFDVSLLLVVVSLILFSRNSTMIG